jgi:archaemetzincin
MRSAMLPRLFVVAFLLPIFARAFEPPSDAMRKAAVGDLRTLPLLLQRALAPDGPGFEPIAVPRGSDWLAMHEEPGQTFLQFTASHPNRPTATRRTIYLQPLGGFPPGGSPPLEQLQAFTAAYFAMEVKVLPPISLEEARLTTRMHHGKPQILAPAVLGFLKRRLPADAFCALAITMTDLYPEDSWNFVFGMASLQQRVGVFSFARYDPAYFGDAREKGHEALIMERSCKVLAHEMAHMFGLAHCIYYQCLMNGSNHLDETDRQPLHLCPVCLRKLQWNTGFNVLQRYRELSRIAHAAGLQQEATFLDAQIESLTEAANGGKPGEGR